MKAFEMGRLSWWALDAVIRRRQRDFPSSPVVRTLSFHCRGREFNPWSRN